jgi:hypothetical protein
MRRESRCGKAIVAVQKAEQAEEEILPASRSFFDISMSKKDLSCRRLE